MNIHYVAHLFEDQWVVLGYDAESAIDALQQSREAYPIAAERQLVGTASFAAPKPDQEIYLIEDMLNISQHISKGTK